MAILDFTSVCACVCVCVCEWVCVCVCVCVYVCVWHHSTHERVWCLRLAWDMRSPWDDCRAPVVSVLLSTTQLNFRIRNNTLFLCAYTVGCHWRAAHMWILGAPSFTCAQNCPSVPSWTSTFARTHNALKRLHRVFTFTRTRRQMKTDHDGRKNEIFKHGIKGIKKITGKYNTSKPLTEVKINCPCGLKWTWQGSSPIHEEGREARTLAWIHTSGNYACIYMSDKNAFICH